MVDAFLGCFGTFNHFDKKRRQVQLRDMVHLETLRRERNEAEKDLELEKKKKEERKLVKQIELHKIEKRDSLYWIKIKWLIKRREERKELEMLRALDLHLDLDLEKQRKVKDQKWSKIMEKKHQKAYRKILEERQELERLRDLDVQLYLTDLDMERQTDEQKRRDKLERKHQKVSWKERTKRKYRLARLEDMEKMRDIKDLEDSLTFKDLERELAAPKESFAQHHQEIRKCEEYKTEIKEGLRRDKMLLHVRPMHREVAIEREMAEVREMSILENKLGDSNKQGNVTWMEIDENNQGVEESLQDIREHVEKSREMMLEMERIGESKRQISEISEKAMGQTGILTEKQTEITIEQDKRQRKLLPELLSTMEKQREVGELELNNKILLIQKEIEINNHKMEPKECEREEEMKNEMAKTIKEKCKWIELQIHKERQVVDMALLEKMERTADRQDMNSELMKEIQIGGELQINKTEIEREKQQVQEEEHFWDPGDLPKSEEVSTEKEESFEIDEELQKSEDIQNRSPKHEEKMQKNCELMQKLFPQTVRPSLQEEKQNVQVTKQEEKWWTMKENLCDSESLPKYVDIQNRSPKHEEKMQKNCELMQKLFPQTVRPSLQEKKQNVLSTKQEEKWWIMKEHLCDSESLPKSEDIQNRSTKHEEGFEIDIELHSQPDEKVQRKEEMLLKTERQRNEEQIKERPKYSASAGGKTETCRNAKIQERANADDDLQYETLNSSL
ncbi:golgin subfamily A member 6-like protein 22 [Tachysurus fulvidraco]|uniref:golgin subfamily A member 6-like protein 22 n=1 Tax=Tachysurus fulvidraco TaxID=1234273 RepID=UPI001FEECF84|nr:golgin subfamily A member 6-like protein 22 [Tachysurus fulvidraco]XP_026994399.2 golgin subfamily A member 6-like protein 22 [Tachysurus fulvidraco]XP_026994400.2 golgin subfamily A member 6-like protein 22 [Tachysurus fulvidraco]XP_026994401.2 golgin subfamily A member 6-like protein 22 [Tachysurus fulvidraco]XP_047675076.1 golgin subfamily A member 6-like protein 22 [Tachysurus fulvidraco]XP_047675077.1 golgin subfamily A member 6-like protein 22 [Tachysurus fulvidraco]XP_047675079.1 go